MTFRDRVGRATTIQSMLGMSAPSVKIAESFLEIRFALVIGRQGERTAIYENWIFPRLETLNQRPPFGSGSFGVHVSRVNSRITKRLGEFPDVGKVDTEH